MQKNTWITIEVEGCFQIDGKLKVENNNGMHYSVS
jgi:hypothetical protein